jgi:hypothetical protein
VSTASVGEVELIDFFDWCFAFHIFLLKESRRWNLAVGRKTISTWRTFKVPEWSHFDR